MSLREEQCKKVCRILDNVLANRPTERDSLILAVRKAFAQPERKKGVWINEGRIIRCNRCKIGYATVKGMKSALTYKFCPNCGADMRGEQDG